MFSTGSNIEYFKFKNLKIIDDVFEGKVNYTWKRIGDKVSLQHGFGLKDTMQLIMLECSQLEAPCLDLFPLSRIW